MEKLLLVVLLIFISCKQKLTKETISPVKITDERGNEIKEIYSGQVIKLTSNGFKDILPKKSSTKPKLYFDTIQVPILEAGPGFIKVKVPVMNLAAYKTILIRARFREFDLSMKERPTYRPRVTAEVFAGYGTTAPDGTFQKPAEMTIDSMGNLYVIDQRITNDIIVKVTPAGITSVFAGGSNEFGRLVGIAINNAGTFLLVSDATSQQIKKIEMASPTNITVLAGSGIAGNTDGTGTGVAFRFGTEAVDNFGGNEKGQGMSVDAMDNIYVGEKYGTAFNGSESQIRKITATGVVTTVPNSLINMPMADSVVHPVAGITLNDANELVYTGGASGFFQGITKVSAGGRTRIAGLLSFESLNDGIGRIARFSYPKAIQYFKGYYYIADGTNGALRRMDPNGNVITLAGVGHFNTPKFCQCPNSGPKDSGYLMPSIFNADPDRYELAAKAIIMDQVGGIAIRNTNLMYLSDHGNNFRCIWKIRIE